MPNPYDKPEAIQATGRDGLVALGLLAAVVALYWPTLDFGFVNFDDPIYVYENRAVLGGLSLEGLKYAFSFDTPTYFHPLTWLSLMADVEVFGPGAFGMHFTNMILHGINAALVYLVFFMTTGRRAPSAFIALLFAVHPLHVESVAWITERKDVLSTTFWLFAMLGHAAWAERPTPGRRALVFVSMALGLMAKPMLVTLPCALILFDLWPLGRLAAGGRFGHARFRDLVVEKLPLFALSGLAVFAASLSHPSEFFVDEDFSLAARIGNALSSYVRYLGKLVWPADLSVYYPFVDPPLWLSGLGLAFLVLGTFAAVRFRRSAPWLAFGFFWYVGTLVPVLKLYRAGLWYSIADRFVYVPFIGVYAVLAFGGAALLARFGLDRRLGVLGFLAVLALVPVTRGQIAAWRDSEALFRDALAAGSDHWHVRLQLGVALKEQRRLPEAEAEFRRALVLLPDAPGLLNNLGTTVSEQGRPEEAAAIFERGLAVRPDFTPIVSNLGNLRAAQGRKTEALELLKKAVQLEPTVAPSWVNLGNLHFAEGRGEAAFRAYAEAIRLDPKLTPALSAMGALLTKFGKLDEALELLDQAVLLEPGFVNGWYNRALALDAAGRAADALESLNIALEITPGHAAALRKRAELLSRNASTPNR